MIADNAERAEARMREMVASKHKTGRRFDKTIGLWAERRKRPPGAHVHRINRERTVAVLEAGTSFTSQAHGKERRTGEV